MAESKRYTLDNQLDIEQILSEAQSRWLRPVEICEILQNYRKFQISPEPPKKPPSGSLFLFDRKILRYFRKDGHNWRKKRDGKTVNEAHERLKAGSVDVLHCYYAHGEDNGNFQRRVYWLLEEAFMHIVLVHYREVKGSKASFSRLRDTEAVSSSQIDSPLSSGVLTNSNHAPSPADSTSLTSAQTSEYEDFEFDSYQASSMPHSHIGLQHINGEYGSVQAESDSFNCYVPAANPSNQNMYRNSVLTPGLNFVSLGQENNGRYSNEALFEVNFDAPKQLDLASWEQVLEHCNSELRTSISSTQCTSLGLTPEQENLGLGKTFTDERYSENEVIGRSGSQKQWQIAPNDDSSHMLKWPVEQLVQNEQQSTSEPFCAHSEQQYEQLLQKDHNTPFLNAELGYHPKSDFEYSLTKEMEFNNLPVVKQQLLDSIRTDEGLTKVDSFTRWMSRELSEVEYSPRQSNSGVDWDAVDSERLADDAHISSQLYLDAYSLSPSLSKEQLFSISDFSPHWAYEGSETKVLISGTFLKSLENLGYVKWSCMFGEVEVPVEVLANSVLCCHAPQHKAGRVPFYVTCSNRVACSEVREFEFRNSRNQDYIMTDPDSVSTSDMLLHTRLVKLLSCVSVHHPYLLERGGEYMHGNLSLLMKEDEPVQMVNTTTEELYRAEENECLLQETLKQKLNKWLLQKFTEDGKGPNVLDKEGQGVIHLASALGFDWAIAPIVAAGVNINFRDVNGWTALHWAAFCGRERTIALLISLGAAPGALTDPTPRFPSGRAPADLASINGHKGIAGYLAESSLAIHLSSLTMENAKDVAPHVAGAETPQVVPEQSATHSFDVDVRDASLKDSLTAVRNATQAHARIYQVYRVQSFQRKQLVENGDLKFGMSDERALSLVAVKKHRLGVHDEPVHVAAVRIQNKFRGWKGRKEFLVIRQQIVKIQAHVRGHRVRKHYRSIIWSVGIVEKVILRWRRKGSGLRGFQSEALTAAPSAQSGPSNEDDYDFLKEGRKQTEERLQKALARVKSMVQYPEARDQYRRLLTVVTDFQETKLLSNEPSNSSDEALDKFDDMVDLDALLKDDTFMCT